MRKYALNIFVSILLLIGSVSIACITNYKNDKVSSVTKSNCFSVNFNSPESEIEYCTIYNYSASHTYHGFQKVSFRETDLATLTLLSFSSSSTPYFNIELFDNNYLSHNYPSHNFW